MRLGLTKMRLALGTTARLWCDHGGDQCRDSHDCGGDAAAYVLGALEPEEAEAFSRHLASAWSAATRSTRSSRSSTRCRWRRRSNALRGGSGAACCGRARGAHGRGVAGRGARGGCGSGLLLARPAVAAGRARGRVGVSGRRARLERLGRHAHDPGARARFARDGPAARRRRPRRADRAPPPAAAGRPHLRGMGLTRRAGAPRRPARSSASTPAAPPTSASRAACTASARCWSPRSRPAAALCRRTAGDRRPAGLSSERFHPTAVIRIGRGS